MRVEETNIYQPSKSLRARIARKIVPLQARRTTQVKLDRPIISITFDDFPRSAIKNGIDEMEKHGWAATLYVAAGLMGVTNHHGQSYHGSDLVDLENRGHEIACHTYSHIDCTLISKEETLKEIDRNFEALREIGVKGDIENFAYPFGAVDKKTKRALEKRFKTMRGINPQTNRDQVDLNCLDSAGLFSGKPLQHALRLIKGQNNAPGWLTLFAHDIRDEPSEWGCTPEEFKTVLAAVKESGALVLPVQQAISYVEENHDS